MINGINTNIKNVLNMLIIFSPKFSVEFQHMYQVIYVYIKQIKPHFKSFKGGNAIQNYKNYNAQYNVLEYSVHVINCKSLTTGLNTSTG